MKYQRYSPFLPKKRERYPGVVLAHHWTKQRSACDAGERGVLLEFARN